MANCESCGRIVVLASTPDGKKITLDPKAPVYRIAGGAEGIESLIVERSTNTMAGHSWACPNARFSAKGEE